MINIEKASLNNIDDLATMALDLWPDNDLEDLKKDFTYIIGHLSDKVLLAELDGKNVGFIHMSIRKDYVEGSSSSPVGYVEGIYVKPEFRNQEIGTNLLEAGTTWAKSKGCTEVGSDCSISNNLSYDFHKKVGFEEANRVICFIKEV